MSRRESLLHLLLGFVWAVLLLGPALGRGYPLHLDMVVSARIPWSDATLALTSAPPRAVPQDAALAVLTTVVAGDVALKLALLAIFVASSTGAAVLAPVESFGARAVAGVAAVWNPYVVERLLLGHWSLLAAYAVLPWLLVAELRRWRWWASGLLLVPAALTPTGLLIGGGVAVAAAVPAGRRRVGAVLALTGALALPWLVPSLAVRPEVPVAGFEQFAPRAEGWGGPVRALLTLGGGWSLAATPASRGLWVVSLLALVVVAVGAVGVVRILRSEPPPLSRALPWCAVAGLALAVAGSLAVRWGVVDQLAAVPGGGLLRDGHKWIAPYALLAVLGFAVGVERLASRLVEPAARTALIIGAVAVPLALLPDAAWGSLGRVTAVRYPAEWAALSQRLAAEPRSDVVLSLPWSAFRDFGWTGRSPVLDPLPRWAEQRVVVDDRLPTRRGLVPGDDPVSARLDAALREGEDLRRLGITWVVLADDVRGEFGTVPPGYREVWSQGELSLHRAAGPTSGLAEQTPPRTTVLTAWVLAALAVAASVAGAGGSLARRGLPAGWPIPASLRRRSSAVR